MTSGNSSRLNRPIVLVGFMASGKSKIGRLLAQALDVPFVDSDAEIESAFGTSVQEIFRTHGEAAFREAERRVIASLVDFRPRVIAIGGGAFVDIGTRETLNRSARSIWLDPPFDVIAERLARSTSRPLALSRSEDQLRQLWEERRPCYAEAHIRIASRDDEPQCVVDEIVRALAD